MRSWVSHTFFKNGPHYKTNNRNEDSVNEWKGETFNCKTDILKTFETVAMLNLEKQYSVFKV